MTDEFFEPNIYTESRHPKLIARVSSMVKQAFVMGFIIGSVITGVIIYFM